MNYKKLLKGLLIALGGAALTYLAQLLPNVNFGTYTPLIVAGFSALINGAQMWLQQQALQRAAKRAQKLSTEKSK